MNHNTIFFIAIGDDLQVTSASRLKSRDQFTEVTASKSCLKLVLHLHVAYGDHISSVIFDPRKEVLQKHELSLVQNNRYIPFTACSEKHQFCWLQMSHSVLLVSFFHLAMSPALPPCSALQETRCRCAGTKQARRLLVNLHHLSPTL